jgi:hypothetical protein
MSIDLPRHEQKTGDNGILEEKFRKNPCSSRLSLFLFFVEVLEPIF